MSATKVRKGNTRLTVDQILDGAADILEDGGWITSQCYDSKSGGHCALGAITHAIYPRLTDATLVANLSYVHEQSDREYQGVTGRPKDPRHVEAVDFFGNRLRDMDKRLNTDERIYHFNDSYLSDVNEAERRKSSKSLVTRFRNAAKAYRKQHAGA